VQVLAKLPQVGFEIGHVSDGAKFFIIHGNVLSAPKRNTRFHCRVVA
jgi:hypothetical protein